jgi:hypothetical protein
MKTENLELDERVANALFSRCVEEKWAVQIQRGIPFQSENGNHLVDFMVDYDDDFPFDEKLSETINRVFNLNAHEK